MRTIDNKMELSTNPDKVDLYKKPSVESDPLEIFQSYGLTPREIELFSWLTRGKTNAEIGLILCIRPGTVTKHLENIYTKLGVYSRIGAVVWFLGIMHQAPKSQSREAYTEVGGMRFWLFSQQERVPWAFLEMNEERRWL